MPARKPISKKFVYSFGPGKADGDASRKALLGGKGANLAEMCRLGLPVPAGFTISTEVCTHFMKTRGRYPSGIKTQVNDAMARVTRTMGAHFGDADEPLLVSVRSGARMSMPGMMETVLNIGLNDQTVKGLIARTDNERFAWDAYRRLLTMYADVVMEKGAGMEPEEGEGIRRHLDQLLEERKRRRGAKTDADLRARDLKELCDEFKTTIHKVLGTEFPQDPREQLWGAISAVFSSWNGKRARSYRRIESIPDDWGTAVNVQAMVFGNMGDDSATGVAFTRNPATGDRAFYGEWLPNAQGEDVVAGLRTPNPLNSASRSQDSQDLPSLEQSMPRCYRELHRIQGALEKHYTDMQDIEFTIQQGRLWILQTRVGKRTGIAAIKIAVAMANERLISHEQALMRVKPSQLDELLHPMVDPMAEKRMRRLAKGLPAGPGGGVGRIVLTADDAEQWASRGEKVILVRDETSPEDVHGMHAAEAILTAKGGMTSHAALVARGWGKCCIVGCGALDIDFRAREVRVDNRVLKEGDWLTLNGTSGTVYEGQMTLIQADPETNLEYKALMRWADQVRRLGVRTNADSPEDSATARTFGAEGIGLCRTEHMFFGPERIMAVRELIVAETEETRRAAVMKLLPYQRQDFVGIFEAMDGLPVTIRLLDPPLHEFVPREEAQLAELAESLGMNRKKLDARIAQLHEANPMLGHRGCRLAISYPEIAEMQARAVFEAAAELTKRGVEVHPEIMIPLIGTEHELEHQRTIVDRVAAEVQEETGTRIYYLVGTMMELPRACIVADKIAKTAEFFSFGTNDLTQTTFGYSRDDVGGFLPDYVGKGILEADPFQTIDQVGVGELVLGGVERGRSVRPDLKIGICGEHGGDPDSVHFFHRAGLDYVSCSPFRVPIARLAAAQAALEDETKPKPKRAAKKAPKRVAKAAAAKKAKSTVRKASAAGRKKAAKKPASRRRR